MIRIPYNIANNKKEGSWMNIQKASIEDVALLYDIMIQAFTRYKNDPFPSTALEESVASIKVAMEEGEEALICKQGDRAIGMVRYQWKGNGLYFYRLSVRPEEQGRGVAKLLLTSLETVAKNNGIHKVWCKVRKSEMQNIKLYESVGFVITEGIAMGRGDGIMEIVVMEKCVV